MTQPARSPFPDAQPDELCGISVIDLSKVRRVSKALESADVLAWAAEVLKALADPTRLKIVRSLMLEDRLCVFACLEKDRHVLLSVRDFPAEHWTHLRGTNPVESSFATVRLTTTKSKGCLSASKKWRRFDGAHPFAEIVRGLTFKDGEKLTQRAA